MLKLAVIVVMVGAVLNVTCVVCALACCCDIKAVRTAAQQDDCQGMIHSADANPAWIGFDYDPPFTVRVANFSPPAVEPRPTAPDLSIDSPPPQASLRAQL
jgi:hypothetical protein